MKYKKKMNYFLLLAVLLLFCACSNGDGTKTVKADKFTDLIFKDDTLAPNPDFAWDMTTEEFLAKVDRPDIFNESSDTFEPYRYSYNEESKISTFTPFLAYQIQSFPAPAKIGLAFDEDGLYRCGYGWNFTDSEIDKLQKTIQLLVEDLNANPNLRAIEEELPDFSQKNALSFPYTYQWPLVNEPDRYLQLLISNVRTTYIISMDVVLSQRGVPKTPTIS